MNFASRVDFFLYILSHKHHFIRCLFILVLFLGIKKWTCKFCSKAFTNSCTLKGHEMIHTGERPHRCPECRKGFITMSAMKKHRMVHFKSGPAYDTKKVRSGVIKQ